MVKNNDLDWLVVVIDGVVLVDDNDLSNFSG